MLNKLKEVLKYLKEIESDMNDIGLEHEEPYHTYKILLDEFNTAIQYEKEKGLNE